MGIFTKMITEQQILLEANDIDSAKSQLIRLYHHMIKYQFNPAKQSSSWIDTIKTSYKAINKLCANKTILNKLQEIKNECYKKGLNKALDEDLKSYGYLESVKNIIPKELNDAEYYYNLDNILSNGIDEFLNKYIEHDYAKKYLEGGNNGKRNY